MVTHFSSSPGWPRRMRLPMGSPLVQKRRAMVAFTRAVEDLLPEIQDGRIFGILVGAQIHFHGEDAGGLEAGADLNQMVEALEHQSGAYQEDEGQSGFGDGERAAQTMLSGGGSGAASTFFQGFVQVRAGGVECGDESEGKGHENDDRRSEKEDAEV